MKPSAVEAAFFSQWAWSSRMVAASRRAASIHDGEVACRSENTLRSCQAGRTKTTAIRFAPVGEAAQAAQRGKRRERRRRTFRSALATARQADPIRLSGKL